MKNRADRQVKRKSFLSPGKRMALAFSQQIAGVAAVLCALVVITGCTVYVQTNLSSDEKTLIVFNPFDEKQEVMVQYSGSVAEEGLQSVLEYVAIRTQMEENGAYSADKEISVTEYYNRHGTRSNYEFEDAVYQLEDLLRWYQYGGLEYINNALYFMEDGSAIAQRNGPAGDSDRETVTVSEEHEAIEETAPTDEIAPDSSAEETDETPVYVMRGAAGTETDTEAKNSLNEGIEEFSEGEPGIDEPPEKTIEEMEAEIQNAVSSTDRMVHNTFLTVDGKTLEEIANSADEYWELVAQLASCMEDLGYNYMLYQGYLETLGNNSSIQYYVQTNDSEGTVYTNLNFTWQESGLTANSYFQSKEAWICYTHSGTQISSMLAEYGIRPSMIVQLLKKYPYAYDVETEVWIAFNSEELRNSTVVMDDLYEGWNPQKMIGLMGVIIILAAWYLMVLIYRLSTTGKRMDEQGQVYIECRWGDGMYLEFWILCICAVLACIVGGSISLVQYVVLQNVTAEGQPVYIYVLAVLIPLSLSILFTEFVCSMARRIRARLVFRQSLLWRIAVHVRSFCKKSRTAFRRRWLKSRELYYARSGILARSVGTLLRENISLLLLAGFALFGFLLGNMLILTCAVVTFIVLLLLIMHNKYRLTLEKEQIIHDIGLIVQGENVQINTENLMPENKQLADSVNTIGKGIQKAVEQSVKDERLKAELLTNVSHDIKTPLTSIISYVDLLKREDLGGNETAQNYLDILDNKSNKLKQLILDLIEISKINSGSLEYEIAPMKPHELLLQALGEYEDKLKSQNLKLIYNNSCQDDVIEADARRLWRVIDNLMSNVCKYSLENTRVYVDVTELDGQVSMMIKNISAQELNVPVEELTERFVRGDISRTTEGSGLGLSIARSLVMAQGGTFALSLDGDLFKVTITFPVKNEAG